MITVEERAWFRSYAAEVYSGAGAIVDLGCFVGSSTIVLAEGLHCNRRGARAKIHAYDRFVWDDFLKNWWQAKDLPPARIVNGSVLPEFLHRTSLWKETIIAHEEDLNLARWNDGPIEFLLVDAMKSPELAETIARTFFPFLLPGTGYLAHQDFAHFLTSWIHVLQFRLRHCFEVVADVPKSGTVVFRCLKQPSVEDLRMSLSSAPTSEVEEAFAYSMGIVSKEKRPNIMAAKAMAYIHRADLGRADEVLKMIPEGTKSLGDEIEKVRALLQQSR